MRAIVKRLRRKLGDDANNPTYILNEPRVGYRMAKGETREQGEHATDRATTIFNNDSDAMPCPDLAIATVAYQPLPRSTAAYGDNPLLALALKPFLDRDRGIVSGEKDDAEATARHRVPVRVGSHTGAEAELVGVTLSAAERVEAVALAVTATPHQSMYAGFLVA